MKIPSATYRWIEYELYNLEKHKKELKLLKEEILLHSPDRLGGKVSGVISDQTGDKVVRLMSDPRINNLENKIKVIERVLRRKKIFMDIYELKYKEGFNVEECCKRMGIEKGIFKFLREVLICKIAKNLGEGS